MSDDYDLSDFDGLPPAKPPTLKPTSAAQARADAEATNAGRLLSHIRADIRELVGSVAGFEAVGADLRARLAETTARDAARAEQEALRDQRITARLIDPAKLAHYAQVGARHGAQAALEQSAASLRGQIEADSGARKALLDQLKLDQADRRAYEARRQRHDHIRNIAIGVFGLLLPALFGYGYHLGDNAGAASAYARARDEVAAADWANTPNGKLARRIDRISEQTIPQVANCSGENWRKTKHNGRLVCYGYDGTEPGAGWMRP